MVGLGTGVGSSVAPAGDGVFVAAAAAGTSVAAAGAWVAAAGVAAPPQAVTISEAKYLYKCGRYVLADTSGTALSDHALLSIRVPRAA